LPWALPSGAHLDDPVLRTGNRALDEQEVPLGVDVVHAQADLRHALRTHVSRHLHALEDARRRRRRADRAGSPDVVRAVRPRAAAEVMALDRALESLADADARHLHLVAGLEDLDRDRLAHDAAVDRAAEFDERAMRADAEPPQVPTLGARELALRNGVVRELHRLVTVGLGGPHLHDRAGPGLDDGDGRDRARVLVEQLRHAKLPAHDPLWHQLLLRELGVPVKAIRA